MSGHRHNSNAGTQNQGNSLGDRACVRQSKLYRTHESGNDVKCILGTANLCWDTERQEGAYKGQKVFDHMQPNIVTNELRTRSNEMKRNINADYANDWSTESGSYKSKAVASSNYRVNDENMLARTNSGRYSNGSDYDQYASGSNTRMASGRAAPTVSNMGGMSLAQFQSEPASVAQPPPRGGRGNGNSSGFAAAMVQPERDYNFRSNPSARGGVPQIYEYKNNIYGTDDVPAPQQSNRSGKATQQYRQQTTAPYAADDYEYQFQESQYRSQYQQPAQSSYDYQPPAQGRQGSYGYGQRQQAEEYAVPGIAAEGAGNREGRSTRPW